MLKNPQLAFFFEDLSFLKCRLGRLFTSVLHWWLNFRVEAVLKVELSNFLFSSRWLMRAFGAVRRAERWSASCRHHGWRCTINCRVWTLEISAIHFLSSCWMTDVCSLTNVEFGLIRKAELSLSSSWVNAQLHCCSFEEAPSFSLPRGWLTECKNPTLELEFCGVEGGGNIYFLISSG